MWEIGNHFTTGYCSSVYFHPKSFFNQKKKKNIINVVFQYQFGVVNMELSPNLVAICDTAKCILHSANAYRDSLNTITCREDALGKGDIDLKFWLKTNEKYK